MANNNQSGPSCSAGNIQTMEINMPCAGNHQSVTLTSGVQTTFAFTMQDVTNISMGEGGVLVMTFADGQTLSITNYQDMAVNAGSTVQLGDGSILPLGELAASILPAAQAQESANVADAMQAVEPAAGNDFTNVIAKPATGAEPTTVQMVEGESYIADFKSEDVETAERMDDGTVLITFKDGTQTTLANFTAIESAQDIPVMTLSDGTVIKVTELLATPLEAAVNEEAVIKEEEIAIVEEKPTQDTVEIDVIEIAKVEPRAGEDMAAQLAAIEPAAGDTGAGPLTGSNNFGSSVLPVGLDPANAVGPIAPTALAFDIPEVNIRPLFNPEEDVEEPAPTVIADQARGYEDTAINFGVTASPSIAGQFITVEIAGIPAGWTPDLTDATTARGVYDAAAGTWTITLNPNEALPSSPVFIPPADSDEDILSLDVTVSQFDPALGNVGTGTVTDTFDVLVDAVADPVNLSASDVTGTEDKPVSLNIATSLQDIDGSEEITDILITDVPAGFSLNFGTDLGGGSWAVSKADLPNLALSAPKDYNGTVTLGVTVVNAEVNLSDTEFDLTNNVNTTKTNFDVTFKPAADAPLLDVNSPVVKEDGSTQLDIKAELQDTDGSEYLVITVENIDSGWTVQTGANNGTYNAATGTWTITLPAGQDYNGSLTLSPPADSDVDMTNIVVTAKSVETDGSEATTTETTNVIVDAVIDKPTLNAQDISGDSGQSYPLTISNAVTDTDGSETLGPVTISGLPNGFTLSAGTEVSNGVWEVPQSALNGLMLNTPNTYEGTFDLTVSVTATDNPSDTEFDTTDNTMTVRDVITVDLDFNDRPPSVKFGANGSGEAQVLEDGSVFAPIIATLNGNTPQQLTVTVTGIDPSWTIQTGANNGTYNAATGTWTITLPAGQNYDGGLRFTPPADSDVDLTGLVVTATAVNTESGEDKSSSTGGQVIVDAVADMPNLDAGADKTVEAGDSVDLNITTSLTDTDGSESLGVVTISGVPNGYSLNKGTEVSNGVWEVQRSDLNGLRLNTPKNGQGSVELTVSVTSTEAVTDGEFNLNNNTATATDKVIVTVDADDKPVIVDSDEVVVDESDLNPTDDASSTISANFGNDTPGTYTVTGTGSFSFTGAENDQLTSNGVPVEVTVSGNDYVGTANGEEIFRLELNENTGNYDFTLSGTLDHADETNPDDVIELKFGVTATDDDGDTDNGFITIGVKDDAPVARDDVNASECEITQKDQDYNVAMILDISGSMEGQKLDLLKSSVANLLNDLGDYKNGQVKVHITPFYTVAGQSMSFMVTNTAELNAAIDFVNSFAASGGTNYEAPMQDTIAWLQSTGADAPISGAETYTYFVSDGDPTRYQDENGNSILVGEVNADVVMDEISGSDGTNEISQLQGLSNEVIAVGIGLDAEALARLDQIDSDGNALDVQDPMDLDATFQSTNPVSGRAEGNVITGENGGANAADDLSKDVDTTVTSVTYDGQTYDVDPVNGVTFTTDHGRLEMSADGDYTFVVTSRDSNGGFSEKFTYTITDGDGDSSSAKLTISCTPKIVDMPPEVTFGGANGAADGTAQVLEDGSVFAPIIATLNGNTPQQLTVTVTGIDPNWTIQTGANNGTYNASTGTWSITLPAGQNYNGGLTFTPPADSDVDLTGLEVTATARNVDTDAEKSSSTDGLIIVDAVADMPNLDAGADKTVEAGSAVALNISASLNDIDGSETLSVVTISGVPEGYSLNKGTEVSNGIWEITRDDLNGLKLQTPTDGSGLVNLKVTVTATESVTDGEFNLNNNEATAVDYIKVTVNEQDDKPVFDPTEMPISEEKNLATPNVITGQFTADFGNDAQGSSYCVPANGKFTYGGSYAGSTLTSGGVAVVVSVVGNTYTAMAGNETVFTFSVNTDGSYRFVEYLPLDHKSATNPNEIINLNFDVCAKDGDGDMAVANFTVRVRDTGSVANDDVVTMYSCDWATVGNVITNYNQDNNGQDQLSVEGPNSVQSVTFEGKTYYMPEDGGQALMVDGDHGSLFMFANGAYSYVSFEEEPVEEHSEKFSYTIVDGDGDVSSADLNIKVVEVTKSDNDAADYGPFNDATNTTINGQAAWKTSITAGAMILGGDNDNVLGGNNGNDTIFGWTGNDTLYGFDGNDLLQGEQGNNVLIGGNGADVFSVHPDKAFSNNYDTVRDFTFEEGDVLDLHDIISGFGANDDIGDFVRIVNSGADKMVQVNTDGQGSDFYNAVKITDHADIDLDMLDVYDMYAKGHLEVA